MANRLLGRRRFLVLFSVATVLVFAAHVTHSALGYGSGATNDVVSDGLYDAVLFAASAICLARGLLVDEDRLPWLLLGAAMTAWATGDDLVLLSLVVGVFAMTRWRAGRGFTLLGASLGVAALADGWFLYAPTSNTYVDGQPLEVLTSPHQAVEPGQITR
jgi:hypothetical protein